MKQDKVLDDLLIFMKREAVKNGTNLNFIYFDFSPSEIVSYINASQETKPEGDDLTAFRAQYKHKDNDIFDSLNKALTEKYIIKNMLNGKKYSHLILATLGSARAESAKLNKQNRPKKALSYFSDKVLVPLVVAVFTAIIVSYINMSQIDKELEKIKEDIQWLKTSQKKSN